MTAQGKCLAATRRPEELGIHSLDEFLISVPDLKAAAEFHTSFGLDVGEEGQGLALYTRGSLHRWATLLEGPGKTNRLHYLSFGVYEEDLAPFAARPSWASGGSTRNRRFIK